MAASHVLGALSRVTILRQSYCLLILCLICLSCSTAPRAFAQPRTQRTESESWAAHGLFAIRGVTVGPIESSQWPERGYGTAATAELLDHLKSMGVNWIAVTPYGRMWTDQSTRITMDFEAPYEDNRRALRDMVAQAHARDMKVMLIPHIWMEAGGERRTIDPGSESRWKTFLRSYHQFIVAWAKDAGRWGVDMYALGQECQTFSGRFGPYWQRLIHDVRSVYPGLLTYSANWYQETHDVLFWDLLDVIGVNAFYELAWDKNNDYEHRIKAREAVAELRQLVEVVNKPLIFTELGFTARAQSLRAPWQWPEQTQSVTFDEQEQLQGYRTMLQAFVPQPWFAGMVVWRYYAYLADVSQEPIWAFSPHGKASEPYLKHAFSQRWAADPSPWPWERPSP